MTFTCIRVLLHLVRLGTPCRVSGLTFDNIAAEGAEFARKAYGDDIFTGMVQKVEETAEGELKAKKLFNYGFLNFLKSGEYHHNNQVTFCAA